MNPTGNFHIVDSLRSALQKAEHGLSVSPGLLKRVLREGHWRQFATLRGDLVTWDADQFRDFITAPAMRGIGSNVELIRRVIDTDPEAQELFERALREGR